MQTLLAHLAVIAETACMTTTKPKGGAAWVSPREASEELGVHYTTIIRGIQAGRITAERFLGRWRIPASELPRILGSLARESA